MAIKLTSQEGNAYTYSTPAGDAVVFKSTGNAFQKIPANKRWNWRLGDTRGDGYKTNRAAVAALETMFITCPSVNGVPCIYMTDSLWLNVSGGKIGAEYSIQRDPRRGWRWLEILGGADSGIMYHPTAQHAANELGEFLTTGYPYTRQHFDSPLHAAGLLDMYFLVCTKPGGNWSTIRNTPRGWEWATTLNGSVVQSRNAYADYNDAIHNAGLVLSSIK